MNEIDFKYRICIPVNSQHKPGEFYSEMINRIACKLSTNDIEVVRAIVPRKDEYPDIVRTTKVNFIFLDYFNVNPVGNIEPNAYILGPVNMESLRVFFRILSSLENQESDVLIVLFPRDQWSGLLDWAKNNIIGTNEVTGYVFNSIKVRDDANDVTEAILDYLTDT